MSESGYQHREEFPEAAREEIRKRDQKIAELERRLEEMSRTVADTNLKQDELTRALAQEANQHGGTQKERDEALILAGIEPLTGLPNRNIGKERTIDLLKLAARGTIKVALFRLDVDKFKEINDTYGHYWGDEVLQEVAKRLARTKRDTDTAYRYGGEEFDIVLALPPDTHMQDIGKIAVRYLETLYDIPRHDPNQSDKNEYVTASFGVAVVNPNEEISYDALSQLVDDAMYAAKHAGRNKVKVVQANQAKINKSKRVYFEPADSLTRNYHNRSRTYQPS